MGIKDFLKVKKDNKSIGELAIPIDIKFFAGKKIMVDAFILIKSALCAIKEPLIYEGKITSHIKVALSIINKFKEAGVVRQVWIFDGKSSPLKKKTIEKRKKAGSQPITYEQIKDIKMLLKLYGVPYLTVNIEAEFYASYFVKIGAYDFVYSTDTDVIIRGGDMVYQKKKQYFYLKYQDVIDHLNISYEELVKIAVLLGCDFAEKSKGIGPLSVLKKINTNLDSEQVEAYNYLIREYKFDNCEDPEILNMISDDSENGKFDKKALEEFLSNFGFKNIKIIEDK